jgi:hypothetical protein
VAPRASLLLVLLLLPACDRPMVEGGQITQVPSGFAFDANCRSARIALCGRQPLYQRCWFNRKERHSGVVVTAYPGSVTRDEAEAARAALASRYTSEEYGPLAELRIDGRPAWGWFETQKDREGKVTRRAFKALVGYAAAAYEVEFSGGEPAFHDERLQREVAQSFRVRSSRDVDWLAVLVVIAVGAGLYLLWRRISRLRAPTPPARS